ncbi:MAG: hypothetical protein ACRD0I_09675 [Acidimicrobiales bacterium]
MKFKFGLAVGFGMGFYLGARAGRERLDRLESALRSARSSPTASRSLSKVRAATDLGLERLRDLAQSAQANYSSSRYSRSG